MDKPTKRITVLVADDHDVLRDAMVAMVRAAPGLEVVGAARDGEEAVRLTLALDPDVVLMDHRMPVMSGVEAIAALRAQNARSAVLAMAMHEFDGGETRMMAAGANECYHKSDFEPDSFLDAIRRVGSLS